MATPDTAPLLTRLLDAARLKYDLHRTEAGQPHAGFRLASPVGGVLECSAMVREHVLQFIAHRALVTPAYENNFWLFNEVNQDWPIGKVYYDFGQRAYHVSLALSVNGDAPQPKAIEAALYHLRDCVPQVQQYMVPYTPLPEAANGATMDDVQRAVAGTGHTFELRREGRALHGHFTHTRGFRFLVELFKTDHRFFFMRVSLDPKRRIREDLESLQKIQRLNALFAQGTATLQRGQGRILYTVGMVLDWISLDSELISHLVERAAFAAHTLDGELPP